MSPAIQASTAEELYVLAKQLAPGERLRLVEKIAHDLARAPEEPARSTLAASPPTRIELLGQVTDLALDPPRFTVRTQRGPVSVLFDPRLLDAARDVWGRQALVSADAVVGAGGVVHDAVAVTIEPVPESDDPVAILEATFGSGADLFASPEGRDHLEGMRGGV